jgi:hypothetical protein
VYGAFQRAGNLPSLFVDQVHPNDAGYDVIAGAFFEAITHGRVGAGSAGFAEVGARDAESAAAPGVLTAISSRARSSRSSPRWRSGFVVPAAPQRARGGDSERTPGLRR